jgi:hypothetical protein
MQQTSRMTDVVYAIDCSVSRELLKTDAATYFKVRDAIFEPTLSIIEEFVSSTRLALCYYSTIGLS